MLPLLFGLYLSGVGVTFLVMRIHFGHSRKASVGIGILWPAVAAIIAFFAINNPREFMREVKREFFQWRDE